MLLLDPSLVLVGPGHQLASKCHEQFSLEPVGWLWHSPRHVTPSVSTLSCELVGLWAVCYGIHEVVIAPVL